MNRTVGLTISDKLRCSISLILLSTCYKVLLVFFRVRQKGLSSSCSSAFDFHSGNAPTFLLECSSVSSSSAFLAALLVLVCRSLFLWPPAHAGMHECQQLVFLDVAASLKDLPVTNNLSGCYLLRVVSGLYMSKRSKAMFDSSVNDNMLQKTEVCQHDSLKKKTSELKGGFFWSCMDLAAPMDFFGDLPSALLSASSYNKPSHVLSSVSPVCIYFSGLRLGPVSLTNCSVPVSGLFLWVSPSFFPGLHTYLKRQFSPLIFGLDPTQLLLTSEASLGLQGVLQ